MQYKILIKTIQKKIKIKTLKNIINKNSSKKLYNSFFSSILRLFFRFGLNFQRFYFFKKDWDFKSIDLFWIIRIGFVKQRNYLPFITLDNYISNNPFCCNLKKLPFESESCQQIYIKHLFRYFPNQKLDKIIKAWKKKLIPGGTLKIQFKLRYKKENLEKLERILTQNNFFIKNIEYENLRINGCVTITAIKQKIKNIPPNNISQEKFNDLLLIIKQNKHIFSNKGKICILGYQSRKISNYLKTLKLNFEEILIFDSINSFSDIPENYFDCVIIANYFEYYNYSLIKETCEELRRILKPNSKFLAIVPEKKNYVMKESAQLFDKGIFLRAIDENNFKFKWINISSSFKMIQILLKNQYNFPLDKKKIKVFLLGVYSLRYTFLNNARWDGQARAFEKLGYDLRIFDIKDYSFTHLIEHIKLYDPDILWIGGKIAYDFLIKYADFFKVSKFKVVYWMWDIVPPKEYDFKNAIDYMFITSKGEIDLYKKSYNLKRVYFMPTPIVPEIIHRNVHIKEEYDVGFAGLLRDITIYPYYKERRDLLQFISQHYNVKVFTHVYNNLPELYSKCKMVFGGTPALKDLELYASNRLYVALSGGCCFITNYFKGLEKLAKNEKHLVWFNNKKELSTLLEKYMSNKDLREEIKYNAEQLAKLKHNYILRITNMLDIINNKTEDFYGFIE